MLNAPLGINGLTILTDRKFLIKKSAKIFARSSIQLKKIYQSQKKSLETDRSKLVRDFYNYQQSTVSMIQLSWIANTCLNVCLSGQFSLSLSMIKIFFIFIKNVIVKKQLLAFIFILVYIKLHDKLLSQKN